MIPSKAAEPDTMATVLCVNICVKGCVKGYVKGYVYQSLHLHPAASSVRKNGLGENPVQSQRLWFNCFYVLGMVKELFYIVLNYKAVTSKQKLKIQHKFSVKQ